MSTETEKLKLFKWDTSNEIDLESDFDIEKTLNENWDKIDDNTEQVSKKNIEQDNSISELQEEIENLRNISNIMPSVNQKGENITLNNTAKNVRFRKFEISGNVKQKVTTQVNYFTGKNIKAGTGNGVGYSFDNSILNLNGTTTGAGDIKSIVTTGISLEAGTYTATAIILSGTYTKPSGKDFAIYIRDKSNNLIFGASGSNFDKSSKVGSTFTIAEKTEVYIQVYSNAKDIVFDNLKVGLQIQKGDTFTQFEEFVLDSPSPENPSEIKAVGSNINIFDITKYDYRNFNEASVEITDSTNFRIIATSSKNSNNAVCFKIMDLTNYAGKTLTLKAKVKSSTSTNKGFLVLRQNNADYTGTKSNEKYDETQNTTDGVITLQYKVADTINDSNRYLFAWFYATRGSDCNANDYVNYTVKMVEGTEAGEYSKYNQGCTKIVKANKNLAVKRDKIWYNSVNKVLDKGDTGYAFIAKVKENSTITINKKNVGNRFVIITSENEITETKTKYSRLIISNSNTDRKTYTFNTNEREKYVFFGYYLGEDETQRELSAEDVQIEISSTATKYTQHEEQSYIMPTQSEMLTDDYFDWDNEEEVHNWSRLVLDGTESDSNFSVESNEEYTVINCLNILENGKKVDENKILCDKLISKYGDTSNTEHIRNASSNYPNNVVIYMKSSRLEESTVAAFKKYLSTNNITIYYKTAAETKITFTDEQKAVAKEIQKATSYEDTTHIYSTDEVSPIFDVEAVSTSLISDVQELKEKTEWFELSKNNITLAYYRKVGQNVEINLSLYSSAGYDLEGFKDNTLGTLPNEFRPEKEISVPVFVRTTAGAFPTHVRLIIKTTGVVSLFNWYSAITIETAKTYISYNV